MALTVKEVLTEAEVKNYISPLVVRAFKREFKPLVNLLNDVLRSVRELSDDTYNVDVTGLYNRLKLLVAIDRKVKCTCSSKYLSMTKADEIGFSICTPITYDTDITMHF